MSKRAMRWVLCAALLGVGALALPADAKVSSSWASAQPVALLSPSGDGDLNGDGHDDLFVSRDTRYDDGSHIRKLTAISGATGDAIWSRSLTIEEQSTFALHVGERGGLGLLLQRYTYDSDGTYNSLITAYDGRTGRKLWATWGDVNRYQRGQWAILNAADGTADRIVVRDELGRPSVIDGADGSRVEPSTDLLLGTFWSHVGEIGDVDRDGLADFAVSGDYLGTRAYSSATTELLWSQQALTGSFTTFRDGTGDGIADLIFNRVQALNGATGASLFAVSKGELRQQGDVNGDRLTDLVHVVNANNRVRGNSAWYQVNALLAPDGKSAWKRTVQAPELASSARVALTAVDDLTGDRLPDFVFKLRNPPERTEGLYLDGDNGKIRQLRRSLGDSLGLAVDGKGVDFLRLDMTCLDEDDDYCRRYRDRENLIKVLDGRTSDTVFRTTLTGSLGPVYAIHATNDRKAELVVRWSPTRDDHFLRAYDGRGQTIRWTVRI